MKRLSAYHGAKRILAGSLNRKTTRQGMPLKTIIRKVKQANPNLTRTQARRLSKRVRTLSDDTTGKVFSKKVMKKTLGAVAKTGIVRKHIMRKGLKHAALKLRREQIASKQNIKNTQLQNQTSASRVPEPVSPEVAQVPSHPSVNTTPLAETSTYTEDIGLTDLETSQAPSEPSVVTELNSKEAFFKAYPNSIQAKMAREKERKVAAEQSQTEVTSEDTASVVEVNSDVHPRPSEVSKEETSSKSEEVIVPKATEIPKVSQVETANPREQKTEETPRSPESTLEVPKVASVTVPEAPVVETTKVAQAETLKSPEPEVTHASRPQLPVDEASQEMPKTNVEVPKVAPVTVPEAPVAVAPKVMKAETLQTSKPEVTHAPRPQLPVEEPSSEMPKTKVTNTTEVPKVVPVTVPEAPVVETSKVAQAETLKSPESEMKPVAQTPVSTEKVPEVETSKESEEDILEVPVREMPAPTRTNRNTRRDNSKSSPGRRKKKDANNLPKRRGEVERDPEIVARNLKLRLKDRIRDDARNEVLAQAAEKERSMTRNFTEETMEDAVVSAGENVKRVDTSERDSAGVDLQV